MMIMPVISTGQNRSVNLLKNVSFDKVKELAKKEKKFIFLDFGSPRCSPCLYMKNRIFTIDSVADFVNERFISVDYTEGDEKKMLSKMYGVYTEPVFLLLDENGNLMHRTEGRSTAGEMLERFRQGIDKENNLTALNEKYNAGKRDVQFLLHYINALHIAGLREKKQEVLTNIFGPGFPTDSLYKKNYWDIYVKYDESQVSKTTLFVMDNMDTFIALYGEKTVFSKIDQLYGSKARVYIFGTKAPSQDPDYPIILKYAQRSNHPNASKWLAYLVPAGYKFIDWVQMAKEIENAVAFNILKGDERVFFKKMMSEQLAWYCDDVKALPYSIKWIDELLNGTNAGIKESLQNTRLEVVNKIKSLSN